MPLPAAERLLLLGRERLAAALLAQRAARAEAEIEVVEDFGGLVGHCVEFIGCFGGDRHGFSTSPTCMSASARTPASSAASRDLVERLAPELIVATGDLTHRGRRDQHERGGGLAARARPAGLAVPGNHDIPYTFPARFTAPGREFERQWETTEPVYPSEAIYVVGLNSVRPWRHQSGGLRDASSRWARERFAEAPAGALRVAAMHHQLIGAPGARGNGRSPAQPVLAALLDAGAELILSGHTHQGALAERHEFESWTRGPAGRRRLHRARARAAAALPARRGARARRLRRRPGEVRAHTYVWRGAEWGLTGVRRFPRGARPAYGIKCS